jgi:hypothetical protein
MGDRPADRMTDEVDSDAMLKQKRNEDRGCRGVLNGGAASPAERIKKHLGQRAAGEVSECDAVAVRLELEFNGFGSALMRFSWATAKAAARFASYSSSPSARTTTWQILSGANTRAMRSCCPSSSEAKSSAQSIPTSRNITLAIRNEINASPSSSDIVSIISSVNLPGNVVIVVFAFVRGGRFSNAAAVFLHNSHLDSLKESLLALVSP